MTASESRSRWIRYVTTISGGTKRTAIAQTINKRDPDGPKINQSSITRWYTGESAKPSPAHAAALALAYGRSPLEAFVAGALLDLEHAIDGLDADSIALLADLGFTPKPHAVRAPGVGREIETRKGDPQSPADPRHEDLG